jgi:hypothetical protein
MTMGMMGAHSILRRVHRPAFLIRYGAGWQLPVCQLQQREVQARTRIAMEVARPSGPGASS